MAMLAMQIHRNECIAALNAVGPGAVAVVAGAHLAARESGHTVFIVGNGDSAATASHMATDLILGCPLGDPPLRITALTDNQVPITATGNDLDFDQIFARHLSRLAQPGDLLIKDSASGNSTNIRACIDVPKSLKLTTIGFTGFDGGELATMVDLLVHVPTHKGACGPVEDVHLAVNHMITEWLKGHATGQGSAS